MISNGNKKKIFIGLSEVAGFYVGLEQGLRELGQEVTRIDLSQHRFKYKAAHSNLLIKAYLFFASKATNSRFLQGLAFLNKMLLFIWASLSHDIFIFSYGSSFFRLHDLKILKLLRKKVIFQFHGSDSRPPFVDGIFIKQFSLEQINLLTEQKKLQMEIINKYADAIIDLPTMGLFHTKSFVNCLHVGLPTNVQAQTQSTTTNLQDGVRILHAPSNSLAKGTLHIEKCIKELQDSGLLIELIKIENLPNEKVLQAIADCDFLVDQLFSDTPMPGLAAEAAWHKKPTILCGYAAQLWTNSLPEELMPPTHYCHPSALKDAIQKLYHDKNYRTHLGNKAYEFVGSHWQPKKIAEKYLDIINGEAHESWYVNPLDITYTHGCCIEEQELKSFLAAMIKKCGDKSLQLDDKPMLKQTFLQFADCQYD